jgi:hypothetical protein
MRIDLYTKTVLTVIALCLLWLCVNGSPLSTPAYAEQDREVFIAGWRDQGGELHRLPGPGAGAIVSPRPLPVTTAR